MDLRGYQTDLIADVRDAWGQGALNVMAVLPTGGGKTVCFGTILREHNGASCAIAHRSELVGQMSTTLAKLQVRHRIIAPVGTIRDIVTRHMHETGRSWHDPMAPAAVAGVDTLTKRDLGSWAEQVTLWVIDECFPAGTLVDGRPIQDLRVGDTVTAFDEKTGGFEKRRVVRVFRNAAPKYMVRLTVPGHHVLYCTPGHPFWTRRGWVEAARLQPNDEVLSNAMHDVRVRNSSDQRIPEVPAPQNGPHFLHQIVRNETPGKPQDYRLDGKIEAGAAERGDLHHVLGRGGPFGLPVGAVSTNRKSVLQSSVFQHLPIPSLVQNDGSDQLTVRVGSYDEKQPDALGSYASEGVRDPAVDRSCADAKRWERQAGYSRRNGAVRSICVGRVRTAPGDQNRGTAEKRVPCADFIQTGFSQLRIQGGVGSGRGVTPRGTEDIGSQEGQLFKWVGLDSIEVYERGDFGGPEPSGDDGFVYNIEVEGLHTYVANGVVVHNCHHLLAANKWGKGVSLFPNARGLAVTATPVRADGRGLGRGSDGLIDYMVQGPTKRELIDAGYLTDYRIFAPASDIDLANVPVSDTTGDFSAPALRDAAKRSHVTGDIVENYMKIAPGKLGVTFCVSVELAGETAARYRAAGVPAEMVSANTPELERAAILRKFARRELLQLVNVDLFGEGFDLPAIEVVSMGRPTASYGLYVQQFGRACRPMENKDRAIIIDHVGNVLRHGLPDAPRIWTLDRRERRARNKEELLQQPVRVCPECTIVYEKFHLACPHCGHVPVPKSRAAPEHVDGDITELDPAVLARLRRESDVDAAPKVPYGANDAIRGAIMKRHRIWKESQRGLRETMALYGGWQKHLGRPQREAYKRFFVEFGVDVATAQGLPTSEATELNARIAAHLTANGVVQA